MTSGKLTERTAHVENANLLFDEADTVEWNGKRWAVVSSEGQFHLRLTKFDETWGYSLHAYKAHGELYRPIHPDMTRDDIEGATYAHDDGTHWLFAHCSPEEHVDFAARARDFAIGHFQEAINRANIKAHEATRETVRNTAVDKMKSLVSFAAQVGNHVYSTVVSEVLGHYHKNPHKDHKRDLAVDAVNSVLATWKKDALTSPLVRVARQHVAADAADVVTKLTSTHYIEWRHVRAARLEAEKKAKETPAEES